MSDEHESYVNSTENEIQNPTVDAVPNTRRRNISVSIEFGLRLVGAVVFGAGGYQLGEFLTVTQPREYQIATGVAMACLFAALGMLVTPYMTTRPTRWARRTFQQASALELVAGLIGLLIGLIFSALLAIPLQFLPIVGPLAPFAGMLVVTYLTMTTAVSRRRDLLGLVNAMRSIGDRGEGHDKRREPVASSRVILDTSAIIDGRIADISQTGFISGPLIVPRFVLNELQHIADSADALRRNRGRRGLDILGKLQKDSLVPVEIVEAEPSGPDVDSKLVKLAKQGGSAILTNDYNLNRVAALQGVRVLNINELANALKSVVLPGEDITVRIIQEGKEYGQGVGYLDDGTMVVVENGRRHLNNELNVMVTRVLQTVAGRMIFGQPKD